ncbi:hypothetical protein GQ53DRAFT_651569 [Thozetella sp. PMI_491]|nr:hypothetical protein GQ53DRAFT_651569 [Thozetella sp. PMI_491]
MLVRQNSPAPAPWRDRFTEHIGAMQPPVFSLATAHPEPGAAAGAVVPRVRTCVFRGLWATLPENDRNQAEKNPPAYVSDLPVFTTDGRMEKMGEILATGVSPSLPATEPPSGGGGPVEAVWWASQAGTQWRVRGHAWVLGPDIETDDPGARAAREAILPRMRAAGGAGEEREWSWRREVTAHFGNLSPQMRGSFRNPPPGRPVTAPPGEGEGLGQRVDDLEDELARHNFRVLIIVPTEVDQTDLSDAEQPRRWLYSYRGPQRLDQQGKPGVEVLGDWEKVEVWP